MPGTNLYLPHAINFASGTDITQLNTLMPEMNMGDITVHSASEVLPGFTGSFSFEPRLSMSTTQVKDILDKMTQDSVAVGYSGSNIDLEWRLVSSLTGRASIGAASNLRTRSTHALLWWESVGGTNGSLAEINFTFQPISDGTNAPWIYTGGVAITATSAVQAVFEPGPVVLNGTTLCTEGWNWNNNLGQPITRRCGASPYLEYIAVNRAAPTVTIDMEDSTVPLGYIPAGGTLSSLTCYLRKKAASGINVANATAEHIAITASVGTIKPINPRQLRVHVHSFAIATTSAIS